MPGLPRLRFGVVDVRDVADLHLRAMTDPRAKGERFLAVAGDFMSMREIALTLKAPPGRGRAPRADPRTARLARCASPRSPIPTVRQIVPELGKTRNATSDKARRLLGWAPRSREDALVATAESLIRLGLLKRSRGLSAGRAIGMLPAAPDESSRGRRHGDGSARRDACVRGELRRRRIRT